MYTNANICHSLTVVIILFVVVAFAVAVLILFDGEKQANFRGGKCRMLQKFLHLNCLFVGSFTFKLTLEIISHTNIYVRALKRTYTYSPQR